MKQTGLTNLYSKYIAWNKTKTWTFAWRIYLWNSILDQIMKIPTGITTTLPEGTRLYWNQRILNTSENMHACSNGVFTFNGTVSSNWDSGELPMYQYFEHSKYYLMSTKYISGTISANMDIYDGYSDPHCTLNTSSSMTLTKRNSGRSQYTIGISSSSGKSFTNYKCYINLYNLTEMFSIETGLLPTSTAKFQEYFPNLWYAPYDVGTDVIVYNGKLYIKNIPNMIGELYTANNLLPEGISTTLPDFTYLRWNNMIRYSNGFTNYDRDMHSLSLSGTSIGQWSGIGGILSSKYSDIFNKYYVNVNIITNSIESNMCLTSTPSSNGECSNNIGNNTGIFDSIITPSNTSAYKYHTQWMFQTNKESNTTGYFAYTNLFAIDLYDLFGANISLIPNSTSDFKKLFPSLYYVPYEDGIEVVTYNGKLYKLKLPSDVYGLYTGPNNEIPEGISTTLPQGTIITWNQMVPYNICDTSHWANIGSIYTVSTFHKKLILTTSSSGAGQYAINVSLTPSHKYYTEIQAISQTNHTAIINDTQLQFNSTISAYVKNDITYVGTSNSNSGSFWVNIRNLSINSTTILWDYVLIDITKMFNDDSITATKFKEYFPNLKWSGNDYGTKCISLFGKLYKLKNAED